jgi:tRNA (mo5U34)-methyltransferase
MTTFFDQNRYTSNMDVEEIKNVLEQKKIKEKTNLARFDLTHHLPKLSKCELIINDQVEINVEPEIDLQPLINQLKPWRKGPFKINQHQIESEWRSDLKWNRLKDHIYLNKSRVLDIGCNNGYFMYRMLEQNPEFVLGIDPVSLYQAQFNFINHFAQSHKLFFEMLGVEDLKYMPNSFDTIFYMGIIYHHRNPIEQLIDIRESLTSGGQVIVETIGIAGEQEMALTPKDRYANMPNVWFVPTLSALLNWLERSKFTNIKIISTNWNEGEEQRATKLSSKHSYLDFLDPTDPSKTIEGYPAPQRFCVSANKK